MSATMRDYHRIVDVRYECVGGKGRFVEPFGFRLLGWLRWEYEYRLRDGWTRASWDIPAWAQSPTAGIVGTWDATRRRLVVIRFRRLPVSRWRAVSLAAPATPKEPSGE